jgi:S1-C subfamily serine protease
MASRFAELSAEIEATVKAAAGYVVRIESGRRSAASGTVWSTDGLVVAAHHTVDSDEDVSVGLDDGRTVAARVVGRDPRSDLVLLQSEARGLPTPDWAHTTSVAAGQLVVGLSRPGHVPRARLGVVSAASGGWRTPGGALLDRYIESDLPLHPGFSGGPLVGPDGAALGLNNAGVLRQTSLALAAEDVRRVLQDLRDHGRVRRGYLGIGTQVAVLARSDRERLGQETALLVVSVNHGSPAAKAGLLLGDALLRLGKERLARPADLLPALDSEGIGRTLELTVLRAGEPRTVSIEVGEREHP